jgi:molybdopterin synthase sulfur carrier subunit
MEILLFGITREIIGADHLLVPKDAAIRNVADLRSWLCSAYPQFEGLSSLAIAVNKEYAEDGHALAGSEEIALIPPVSGG